MTHVSTRPEWSVVGRSLNLRPAPRRRLSQAFSEYQVQQMTAAFVDQFGFNDEEFADQDDSVK